MNQQVEEVLSGITKLNLQPGDVLVLSKQAARWFSMLPPQVIDDFVKGIGTDVQVIVGDASKLTRSDLLRLLENTPVNE